MVVFMPMSMVVIGRAERDEKLHADEFGDEWKYYTARALKWIPKL